MKRKITILVLFLFNALAIAQHSVDISFNESIDLGIVEGKTQFIITNGGKSTNVKGEKINSYKFEKPGTYQIKVIPDKAFEKDGCGHDKFPHEITVNVSRIKMTFDAEKMLLSESIQKNKDTKGTVLSIPVEIKTFDHQPAKLDRTIVNSAGIGTAITANLQKDFNQLEEGKHLLQYDLNGVVNQNSFIMFDFIDANGKVQSIALQTPIKN